MLLSLDRHLYCWTISHREYHPSCCQCYYHWIDTSAGGLLVTESIIRPVVSVTITESTPLLVDYQSYHQLSEYTSAGGLRPVVIVCFYHREYHPSSCQCYYVRHLCWWTISHREYHPSSSQCYYHWIDTSAVGLLVTESIIRPVVSVSITGSHFSAGGLLVRESIIRPVVSVSITGSTPLLVDYINQREYHPSCCQCYYHWIDTSAGRLLVTESIIRPVVSVSITGSTPLLVDYQSQSINRPVVSVTTTGSTPLLVDYQSQRVSSLQQSVFLSLDRNLCWWTISHREYHPSSSQCFYHQIDTSAVGLLVTESVIHPIVSVTTTGSTPLLLDYQSQKVSFFQQSVFLSLDRHLCWWTISHREYHPSSFQRFYHWIETSAVELLVTESIIRPVVSVIIT